MSVIWIKPDTGWTEYKCYVNGVEYAYIHAGNLYVWDLPLRKPNPMIWPTEPEVYASRKLVDLAHVKWSTEKMKACIEKWISDKGESGLEAILSSRRNVRMPKPEFRLLDADWEI